MKILLVGNYPNQNQPSMQRFAEMLADGLREAGEEVRLIRPEPVFGKLKPGAEGLGKWLGYLDRFLIFPWILLWAKRWADVVHICDHGNAVYVPLLGKTPNVVSCHDLFGAWVARGEVAGMQTGRLGKLLAEAMLGGLGRAQMVVCNSTSTRQDLLRLIGEDGRHKGIPIVEYGMNYSYRPMPPNFARASLDFLDIPAAPFFIHIGGNQWYKNRLGVLYIYSELVRLEGFGSFRLVLAGKPLSGEMRRFIADTGLNNYVLERTELSNEDLRALYSTAEALIWPSLAEGFGWPVIEAQACGCPVFASNRPPIPEVGGEGGVYFDPEDPEGAARIIRDHWDERKSRTERGYINIARFTVERMTAGYTGVYRDLVRGSIATESNA